MDLHRVVIPNSFQLSIIMLVDFCLCDRNSIFFRDLMLMKVSELNRLFGSLLDEFVGSFAHADVLASIEFDSDRFIDYSFSVVSSVWLYSIP